MTADRITTQLRDVTVVYRSAGEQITALDGVALDVASGEAVVIAGPSGSGKSTMLRLLAGFDQPSAGTVMVDGVELSALGEARRRRFRRGRLAVVHQRPLNNLIGDLTAAQHVDLAGRVRRRRTPADVLARFGLGERRDALPRHLSGGEQQRLAIAMAVASGVSVVLADEPTAELDRAHAQEVIDALQGLAGDGVTVVTASHDADVVGAFGRVVRMRDGAVVT